ncbi:S8 family peptidase [Bacillus massilinigeriensis]|uniref:S8 family peptidase n=1 Tax=Bacillus massilionigeriensis TaxID=1805475 RepID=UPI000A0760FC|nr:S8 family peptidase [Bacillus massilionigeriensis]
MRKRRKFLAFIMVLSLAFGWGTSESANAVEAKPIDSKSTSSTTQVMAAKDRVLVKMKSGKSLQDIKGISNLQQIETIGNWSIVKTPSDKAEEYKKRLLSDPAVEAAELDYVHTVAAIWNDPNISEQWHLAKMSLPYAWDIKYSSFPKTIAVLDTGVNMNHPDLKPKIVPGIDTVNNDSFPQDDHGHGTHVSGVAAAIGNNSLGGSGVDPFAKIMPVKVLSSKGDGLTSNIIRGLYFAANNGANVVLMPYTSPNYSQAYQEAIHYAWLKGKVLVAPAGNEGATTKQYPAAYNDVLSVAATNQQDMKTTFSNYSIGWVDVAAPGQSIYATSINGGYTSMSGTSMASAAVAGLVSLTWNKNSAASNRQVVNRITSTADPVRGTGSEFIYGRVNAYKALNGF